VGIKVLTKNFELNLAAEAYIQKKFERLHRHLKPIKDAKLEVTRTSARSPDERIVAQMTIDANGYTLRGQESGTNVFVAVDAVTDVMDRQIQRYKGKVYRSAQAKRSGKSSAARVGLLAADAPVDEEPVDDLVGEPGTVVRTKRFPMGPMAVEDAILEMELLSHDFFLFYNAATEGYNVVYRRRDGDYGLIEPELT
jgi:putative sigma-54 modulation protein